MNGNYLFERRIECGLSQSDIAKELGYSIQMISLWESDKQTPSLNVLSKYASILRVDLEGLILNENHKNNSNCDNLVFDAVKFGNFIKVLRNKKKLTQKELAEKIGVPTNAIIRFEKGNSLPSIEQFITLSKLFKKSFDELYFCLSLENDTKPLFKKRYFVPICIAIGIIVLASIVTPTAVVVTNNLNKHVEDNAFSDEDVSYDRKKLIWQDIGVNVEKYNFGTYPSSKVNDKSLIDNLVSIKKTNKQGYVEFNGNCYEKVSAVVRDLSHEDNPTGLDAFIKPKFDSGEEVKNGETYWFKVEPIVWRVAAKTKDQKSLLLISDQVLDADILYNKEACFYEDSYLRQYLHNTFCDKAFYNCKKELLKTSFYYDDLLDYITIPDSRLPLDLNYPYLTSEYARCKKVMIDSNNISSFWIDGNDNLYSSTACSFYYNCGYNMECNSDYKSGILPIIRVKTELFY